MSNSVRGVSRLAGCLLLAFASVACSQYQTTTALSRDAVATSAVIQSSQVSTAALKPLSLQDIMQFREISQRQVSKNQQVMLYTAVPDFGDSTGYVVHILSGQQFSVPHADRGQLTADGAFALFRQQAPLLAREQAADKKARDALAQNAVLLNTTTGESQVIANIDRFAFSGDSQYALLLVRKADSKDETQSLQALHLASGKLTSLGQVTDFAAAETGPLVAWVAQHTDKASKDSHASKDNNPNASAAQQTLIVWDSAADKQYRAVAAAEQKLQQLQFNQQGTQLAFFQGPTTAQLTASKQAEAAQQLWLWAAGTEAAQQVNTARSGWLLSEHSAPRFSEDGQRLFIGHRPDLGEQVAKPGLPQTEAELYDINRLVADRRLQVWHGEDDRINSQQKAEYKDAQKRTAPSVIWLDNLTMVVLSEDIDDRLRLTEHSSAQLISNGRPYLKQLSWNGRLHDMWHVDLKTGKRQPVFTANRSQEWAHLSPDGRYVVYLQDAQYRVFDSQTGQQQPLGADVAVSWVDEENDLPMPARSYGVAGWLADNATVLVYDRFDIWALALDGTSQNLTQQGRANQQQYRVERTDKALAFAPDASLLLAMYHEEHKGYGFAKFELANGTLSTLVQGAKRYDFVEALEQSQRYLFTEQSFRQFPDLWQATYDFTERRQLTDVNPQQSEFIWGDSHLIDWTTADGERLQGVVLTPDGYDATKRYPVMVYYYEQFSQRLNHYNQMKINHRPNFPLYLGQDYVVFLPDIRFRAGAPGPSATESLVPGVQKLIDLGIADPKAVGLHGHSWSGYQTAFVVTETDMFAAAVSGAPVSNMTSAYSGIRWESGLARQFQYETGQSRIGPSMFENLKPYIDNSPVFFAERINTPMLIQFGDDDGAVPWEQGIEYYLALRRLNKPVVMLQYEGEPHHLQQYANKIDYTLKMLEFFDHYLKGKPAPEWWQQGMPYQPTSK